MKNCKNCTWHKDCDMTDNELHAIVISPGESNEKLIKQKGHKNKSEFAGKLEKLGYIVKDVFSSGAYELRDLPEGELQD